MKLSNAITLLKKHGVDFQRQNRGGKTYFSAVIGNTRLAVASCDTDRKTAANPIIICGASKRTYQLKTGLAAAIANARREALREARNDELSDADYEDLRQSGVLYWERN